MFKDINRLHKHCMYIMVMLMLAVPFLTGFDIVRKVAVQFDGQTKIVETNANSPAEIIKKAGVELQPGDGWRLVGKNKRIQDGSTIEVVRAVSFTVVRNHEEIVYKSSKETVGEALKGLGIRYGRHKVYPEPDTKLEKGMKVYVLGPNEKLQFAEEDIAPGVEYVEDFNVSFGQEIVKKEGVPGRARVVSLIAEDKKAGNMTQELHREVLKPAENKVVVRGLARSVKTPEGYKKYSKKLVVESTAYTANCGSNCGRTSIGLVPYEGIVAVDPRVIPYYTKMYIPGYGIAMAGDTGGSIVGNTVDVYMNDWHRAIQWGRRTVEVYILED